MPFNPSTKISWQSPVGGHQTLKIYDILGNEVITLVNEYREAGRYEVNFNASALASGVYIYRIAIHSDKIQAGSFTNSKKMMFLK
ncbi:MAG TPA: T9SS type A sorting domain-containing protein [Ignavibacteriaceae bacterium]|nr:T9SS type A sorting domain-containing protein [Ignavibacteriaceae bacterium]HRP91289.1 T9SS type A sorting domain-containing protein [Ignavibacteriaceae bacterium]HRQ55573.1 T9SS type A sorting domain-containing protein [Ignavibacteriaceae bacterium]